MSVKETNSNKNLEQEFHILRKRLEREIQARKQAESILEQKALELFHTNEELRKLNENLEKKVAARTKALVNNELHYKRLIESMELGILEVNNEGIISRAYDWFCDMTGYSEEELIGRNATNLLVKKDQVRVISQQDANRKRGQAGVYELQIKKKDGTPIWVLISGAPLYDAENNIVGSIGIHYDITYQKELQAELIKAKKVAEQAQRAEKQFLANMSHEIRTPLNAVIGMTHLLFDTKLGPKQKEYLSILKSSADLLKGLINDILDFSKIEAGQMEVSPKEFDLVGLLKSVEKTFQLKVEQKDIEITSQIDPKINSLLIGDDLLLNQILFNLVGNAVKFTNKGSVQIAVEVFHEEGNKKWLQFHIIDTGIGIPQEKQKLIFQDFKQVSNEIKLRYGGTGLGLAITRRLIEMQEGSIDVESEIGKGTTFSFILPYEDTGRATIVKNDDLPKQHPIVGKNCKVLVVEDNMMNRKYIKTLLKKWEVQIDMVHDGREAIEICRNKKFDIIFMDIQMPNMDGYEATIAIRNTNNLNKNIPIIALTASAITQEKDKALEVGMSDFLSKPFAPVQLLRCLNKYISQNSENQDTKEEEKEEVFSFNVKLDVDYLNDCYEGDLEYASDMFEIFLEYTIPEMKELDQLVQHAPLEEIQKAIHKVKPSFAMVGLTHLTEQMARIEQMAKENSDISAIQHLLAEAQKELNDFIPILHNDLQKMRAHHK